jgi:hypothetical protein
MSSVRGDEELVVARLHRDLIRTSMARNAKQINAPVGAEVFSLAQQQFEKYGSRASNKPCDFNHIKNPYQIPVVHRSREKRQRENTGDAVCRFGSAELRSKSLAKRGDFHVVASQERKLATTRLAERVGFETAVRTRRPPWFGAIKPTTIEVAKQRQDQLGTAHFAPSKNPQPSMPVHKRLLDSCWTLTERFGITS